LNLASQALKMFPNGINSDGITDMDCPSCGKEKLYAQVGTSIIHGSFSQLTCKCGYKEESDMRKNTNNLRERET